MFVNLSRRPSSDWEDSQLKAAGGVVTDLLFPNIPPDADVATMAKTIITQLPPHGTVLIDGEFSLAYELTRRLRYLNWIVVTAVFVGPKFVRFREIKN